LGTPDSDRLLVLLFGVRFRCGHLSASDERLLLCASDLNASHTDEILGIRSLLGAVIRLHGR
jgi:hypothetical protein